MTLYDVLRVTQYTQRFYVYVTNAWDQNTPVGTGTRSELLDEEENELTFDHLMDQVEMMTLCKDGAILLRLRDDTFNILAEKQYDSRYVEKWDDLKPETRPWKHSCEMEDFGLQAWRS